MDYQKSKAVNLRSSPHSGEMGDSKVETIARHAQWKIESFGPTTAYKRSDLFKMGIWNWHLLVERSWSTFIRLFPEPSRVSKEQPPVARFVLRVTIPSSNYRSFVFPVQERLLRTKDDFSCPVEVNGQARLVIDVEFMDLKISSPNGGERSSIWPGNGDSNGTMQHRAAQTSLRCLSRMLDETIHTDVTINTADGQLQAHRAIISSSSPVFHSMFEPDDLNDREWSSSSLSSSTIDIQDMTSESCSALLHYLYGSLNKEEFWKHRLALLGAANKYDMGDLKDACIDSLVEDINSGNVLERLQQAWLHQLSKLKEGCLMYLIDFGKIYDTRDGMNDFLRKADPQLVVEVFQELLAVWKPT
ncbi:BTB/POZ domain-containing protein At1g21780-like [Andrographis paniculata]|uniref:BTB/POZ domain-containing protein At1g21780-like n=1 Tax=Andrographis paniculata TaxID=175694 RepID=UPI0021E77786|nr:BTB/POZ domain-containing protein At1g21780-like [Andrographis paniculata]